MKKFSSFLISFVFVNFYSLNVYADTYLCIAEKVTGFIYEETTKNWRSTNFTQKDKWLIKKTDPNDNFVKDFKRVVQQFGNEGNEIYCKEQIDKYGFLYCTGALGTFRFNNKSLRYLYTHVLGYYNTGRPKYPDKGSTTPYIEIGTCSKM